MGIPKKDAKCIILETRRMEGEEKNGRAYCRIEKNRILKIAETRNQETKEESADPLKGRKKAFDQFRGQVIGQYLEMKKRTFHITHYIRTDCPISVLCGISFITLFDFQSDVAFLCEYSLSNRFRHPVVTHKSIKRAFLVYLC